MTGRLVVDVGTATVSAATVASGQAPTIVEFGSSPVMPAGVAEDATTGIATGPEALETGQVHPEHYLDQPLGHIGDDTVRLGNSAVVTADLLTQVIGRVWSDVVNHVRPAPDELILTHPWGWSTDRISTLNNAGNRLGVSTTMVPEPYAAAARININHGRPAVLIDAGASALKIAVLRFTGQQYEAITACDIPSMGGAAMDRALLEYAATKTDSWNTLMAHLGDDGNASHRLAIHAHTVEQARIAAMRGETTHLNLPGFAQPVPLGSDDVRFALQQPMQTAMAQLQQALSVLPHYSDVYLYGGAARDANVQWLVRNTLGQHNVAVLEEPDTVVASGAALHFSQQPNTAALGRHRISPKPSATSRGAVIASGGSPATATTSTPTASSRKPGSRKKRITIAAIAATVTAVLVGTGAVLWPEAPADPTGPVARKKAQRRVTSLMPTESAFDHLGMNPVVVEGARIREGYNPSLSTVSCNSFSTSPIKAERNGRLARSKVSYNRPGNNAEGIIISVIAFTEKAAPQVLPQARTAIRDCLNQPGNGYSKESLRPAPPGNDTIKIAFDVTLAAENPGTPDSLGTCVMARKDTLIYRVCGTSSENHEVTMKRAKLGLNTVMPQ